LTILTGNEKQLIVEQTMQLPAEKEQHDNGSQITTQKVQNEQT